MRGQSSAPLTTAEVAAAPPPFAANERLHGATVPPLCPPPASSPSSVSPLAADEYSPALSVDSTVPPSRTIADSKESRVRVEGS